jgi:hypothetical protein
MSRYHSRGGLEVVPGGYRAARGGSRLVEHNQKETPSEFAPVRVPRAHLLRAAAASLLEVIADDAPRRFECLRTRLGARPWVAKPDRVLSPALICMALGLLERQARHRPAEAALISAVADLLGGVSAPAPPPGEPAWPGEPLTESEPACCATCRPTWVRRRSPPSSTSPQTQSRPTCGTCTQPRRAQPPLGRAARPGHRPARRVLPARP